MKKLLFVTDMFPNRYNSVSGVFVKHQVDEIAKQYKVMVLSTSFPHKYDVVQDCNFQYEVTQIFYPIVHKLFLTSGLAYWLFVLPTLRKIVNEWKPDLIHVHDCRHFPELVVMKYFLDRLTLPKFLSVHNIRTHPSMVANRRFHWLYKLTLNKAYENWTHIFTVNDKLKKILSDYASPENISVIGNAIGPTIEAEHEVISDLKEKLSKQSFKIISVGNLIDEKGFDLLLKAVYKIINKRNPIQLVIVGSGPEEIKLKKLIISMGLGDSVFLIRSLENKIVRNLYSLFDAFVLPSYSETFGIVYLEAMFAGLPVIGVKEQGIDGVVVHGVNGLLAKPRDIEDLVKNIQYLMQNKVESQTMAEKGMTLVLEKYQMEQLINRFIEYYEK